MKIKKLNFISFGRLVAQRVSLSDGVNIIYGKNESGKSTITEGIIALLYGLYPTSKEKNQLVNWDHHELSIKGEIKYNQETYEVSRGLKSQPMGAIKKDNEITQIGNSTLTFIQRIPLPLYRDLYCLDTKMIDQLQRSTWEKVDSQMIFSYNKTVINNPEDVLKKIDEELNQIWRESNRGNFRLKTIEEEIHHLKREKSELISIYKDTKNDIGQIDELKVLIKKQKNQLDDLEVKRRRIKKLMPVANICIEKENLTKDYENYSEYRLLPKDILDDRRLLIEQIKNLKDEILSLEEAIEKKDLGKNKFSKIEELIIKDQELINQKVIELKELINQKEGLKDLETREKLILDEYKQLFYKIFNKICTEEDFTKVKNTSIAAVGQHRIDLKMLIGFILSIIIGGAFYYFNQMLPSVLFFSLGIASLMTFFLNKKNEKEIKGLSVPSETIDSFKLLKEKEFQLLSLLEEKNQLNTSVLKKEKVLKLFFNTYKKTDNLQVIVDYFATICQVIQKKKDENKNIDFLIKEFEISLNKKKHVLKNYERQLEIINHSFVKLSTSTIENGIEIFKYNRKIKEQLKHLDEKLDAIENGQLLLEEYRSLEEVVSTEELNLIEIEMEQLNSKIMDNQVTLAKLEEKVENVSITEEIQSVGTEIDLLVLEKKELVKRKNQLLAMKEIIKKSNESFKDDYQPNIIKDANEYFNAFTYSKYDKILINQETKEIYLDLGKYNKDIQSGFSRGTMDQLFLALRLGVMKHYEKDTKMPLLLDEFFSNWDQERLIAFVETLKIIQNERQVIITTCKKNIVDTFSRLMAIDMIQIEGDGNE